MWLSRAAIIQTAISAAAFLAVRGIRNKTANTVSTNPDPMRNTGSEIRPCTAFDIAAKAATEIDTPANFKKMAA